MFQKQLRIENFCKWQKKELSKNRVSTDFIIFLMDKFLFQSYRYALVICRNSYGKYLIVK